MCLVVSHSVLCVATDQSLVIEMIFCLIMVILLSQTLYSQATMTMHQLDIFDIFPIFKTGARILFKENFDHRKIPMLFDPNQATRYSQLFQKTYGIRGENLINALGAGLPIKELQRIGAV